MHIETRSDQWCECWDLMSVKKYREYILVLASIPSLDGAAITESFNKKFSRTISRAGMELLINTFWNLKGLTTAEVKTAVDGLGPSTLAAGINKLLFGNPVAAAKSVGATLRLNYGLILEEMLADAYLKYKECVENKTPFDDTQTVVKTIMRIGDRIDKMSKKDTDVDVLQNLLAELKLETENTSVNIDDFMKKNTVL
jgi:hypothetical protein